MEEMKGKSIWDEVDAPDNTEKTNTQEQFVNIENQEEDNTNSSQDKTDYRENNDITGHENRGFELKLETDDNAEKKGLISIIALALCGIVFVGSTFGIAYTIISRNRDMKNSQSEMDRLRDLKNNADYDLNPSGGAESVWGETVDSSEELRQQKKEKPEILEKYKAIYEENNDLIGWLTIDDTVIDYPVMQTPDDEEYYLHRGFDKKYNDNGCLIMDTDSNVGTGTEEGSYMLGEDRPSDNLIIHGHTMKNGEMFGNLSLYKDKDYAEKHKIIKFDSLYESREYEVIAVFYSQVYYTTDTCFKYYKFFNADNQEEFDDWYDNIRNLSLYDTGVSAKFGDEFITLSCCAYHVEDGRFVVVGKRIK